MQTIDHDLVIIGGGPAGLTAAIYATRARLNVLLIEMVVPGGQVLVADWIENYPGFPDGISGADLVMKMSEQARNFGITIESEEVTGLDFSGDTKKIVLGDRTITAHAIIIATGASPRKLDVPGEDRFFGKGISSCATCDAPLYKDKVLAAVGGGDTAVQEAIFLTKFASKVYLIHRRDQLRATRILQERALANDKLEIIWDSVVTEIVGGLTSVEKVTVKNVKTGDTREIPVDGCFIWVGIDPNAGFVGNTLDSDASGFIITDQRMETSVPGVFAAGDVRNTPLRQIATSVGDAAIAAHEAGEYIEKQDR
ncbi:MAG: thioredoxin-disulfide reductase [Thermodesulfobacteriota bacterium]|nr:thioredoxin-disulfide reductase [Thermodesulfobacteriota bacterium]